MHRQMAASRVAPKSFFLAAVKSNGAFAGTGLIDPLIVIVGEYAVEGRYWSRNRGAITDTHTVLLPPFISPASSPAAAASDADSEPRATAIEFFCADNATGARIWRRC